MKKTFELTHPKIKVARMVESVKHEVKKYIKRERNKSLPEDTDYWDFDCKIGKSAATADVIHVTTINQQVDTLVAEGVTSFYLEILVKPATRSFEEK
ncbi:hypothetical protein FGD67_21430 [Colwellia sp. M166]|uniref:DUF6172 family protein n=1 Tax=Colwellia sp. M166 TaxID=2583805 RepID=UPI00211E72FE|nr:DUF6172 family protein [Colwellia sp. M166]UUO25493.1 hypothetical protein FGD67_21430 [Colwellia sp. M166]|tara:strand:+ start:135 stop:425 length:291 start_codon:yes stop_codon:yes gene_type:complete